MSYIQDYVDAGYISADTVDSQIEELERILAEEGEGGLDLEGHEELAELRDFRVQVRAKVNAWSQATIVEADCFEEHVRDEAENLYGVGADDLGPYVDWERYARDMKMDWGVVVVGGVTFYVR